MEYDGAMYRYVHNLQGDIVAIVDDTGSTVVEYKYDAWGNAISTNGSMASMLGSLSVFRYRGYVYDTETGFYYQESRYYNPETNRFINADALVNTTNSLLAHNIFTYCVNNPTYYVDRNGMWLDTFFDVASLIGSICEVIASPANPIAWASLAADVVSLAVPGFSGGGQIVRVVCKYDDVADAVKIADQIVDSAVVVDKVVDTTQAADKTISAMKMGQDLHAAYDPLKNIDNITGVYDTAIPGHRIRPDVLCEDAKTVYELKPFNARSLRKGLKQAANYANVASNYNPEGWTIVVDMYVK